MAQRGKFSAEEKLEAVLRSTEKFESQYDIARDYGVDHQTIRNWVMRYETAGFIGLVDSRRNGRYSEEIKRRSVEDYIKGVASQADICKKYKIRAIRTLQCWIDEYNGTKKTKPNTPKPRNSTRKAKNIEISWEGLPLKMVITKSLKCEAVEFCLKNNHNYAYTAEKYGVNYAQVYSWVKKYEEYGEAGLEDRRGRRKSPEELSEIDRLKEENRLLKAENKRKDIEIEVLKKAQDLGRR